MAKTCFRCGLPLAENVHSICHYDLDDCIRALQAENKVLREALEIFANPDNWFYGGETETGFPTWAEWIGPDKHSEYRPFERAQAALGTSVKKKAPDLPPPLNLGW